MVITFLRIVLSIMIALACLMIKHYNINFIAPVILAQCMKKQNLPGSVILNILDREISLRTPDKGSYLISRKALAEATLELAKELSLLQIRVNAIAPGVTPPVRLRRWTAAFFGVGYLLTLAGVDDWVYTPTILSGSSRCFFSTVLPSRMILTVIPGSR